MADKYIDKIKYSDRYFLLDSGALHDSNHRLSGTNGNFETTGTIKAGTGIFNELIAVSLSAKNASIDELTAQNATVMGIMDVKGKLMTNSWEATSIANVGGSFYISPTGKDTGTPNVTITCNSVTNGAGTYTIVVGKGSGSNQGNGFGVSSTSSSLWSVGSRVLMTGNVICGTKNYPLGSLDGLVTARTISTNVITSITLNTITSSALDLIFTEQSTLAANSSITGTSNGSNMQISLYQSKSGSYFYPIGILLSSYGQSDKQQYIDIYSGSVKLGYQEDGTTTLNTGMAEPSLRIGQLDGLPAMTNGETPSGWGIYTTNGYFKGKITAENGVIGMDTATKIIISDNTSNAAIYSGSHSTLASTANGFYIGTDGISIGSNFNYNGSALTVDGEVIVNESITADKIVANAITTNEITANNLVGTNGWINLHEGKFFYTTNGSTWANTTNGIMWDGTSLNIKGKVEITSSDTIPTKTEAQGYASTAESNANSYADGVAATAQKYATAVYGTCTETGASTAAKVVTLANFNLFTGAQITVKFSYANTASAPTLNVNSTGAKAIYVNKAVTSTSNPLYWAAGAELHFTYNGSYWKCDDVGYGYSTTCSTAATTAAKTGAQTGAIVTNGTTVALTCTYANTVEGALSFNFASTGAANIYQHNAITSSSNALVWSAGATVTFVRRGSYWYYVASTTIDGDNIKTGKIKANLGGSYIDLDSGDMLLGDASTYEASTQGLMWDESSGSLKIKGQITVESGSNVYSKTDADTAIGAAVNSIEIGGRNKAALSYIWSREGSTYTTNGVTFTNLGGGRFSAVGTATNAGDIWWCNADSSSYQLGKTGTFTYSIYLESGTMPANIGLQCAEADSTPTWKKNNRSSGGATTYTFTVGDGNHPYHLGFWTVTANTAINITFRLKFEEGNKATDWTPAPEDVQNGISDAEKVARNYVTDISGTGIYISPANQSPSSGAEGNSVKIDGTGMEVFKGGVSVAKYGTDARVGATSESHLELSTRGIEFYSKNEYGVSQCGTIGLSNGGVGTTYSPYSTFGIRGSGTIGRFSVTAGATPIASGYSAFAQGQGTASGDSSFAINAGTASGDYSFASGSGATASGDYSFACGEGTTASGDSQTVVGKYNASDSTSLFIVGNGTAPSSSTRKNAFRVDSSGSTFENEKRLISRNFICYANSIVRSFSSGSITMSLADLGITTGQKPVGILLTYQDGGATPTILRYDYDASSSSGVVIKAYDSSGKAVSGNVRFFALVFQNSWTSVV